MNSFLSKAAEVASALRTIVIFLGAAFVLPALKVGLFIERPEFVLLWIGGATVAALAVAGIAAFLRVLAEQGEIGVIGGPAGSAA